MEQTTVGALEMSLRVFSACLIAALALSTGVAVAQDYPTRTITAIVPFPPGGPTDTITRIVAEHMSRTLGQTIIIENIGGAGGTLGMTRAVQAKPDGYTILYSSNGIAPTPYIYKNLGYDIFTDLTPIASVGVLDGLFMLVDAKSPYKTLQQFIAHAKKDRAVYGSPGVGNGLHLAAEIFSKKAGISMQHIPYKGASEVMTGMPATPSRCFATSSG
jgi:tripartite-type tricarboxylate transporter receptor subunit TctC